MSECVAKHELFEYDAKMPFLIFSIEGAGTAAENCSIIGMKNWNLHFMLKAGEYTI